MTKLMGLFFLSLAFTISAGADTVSVPVGQQASEKKEVQRPEQGMTKSRVKELFGEPKNLLAAVGEPPISRWIYDDFTVYFEYNKVIHSVLTPEPNS